MVQPCSFIRKSVGAVSRRQVPCTRESRVSADYCMYCALSRIIVHTTCIPFFLFFCYVLRLPNVPVSPGAGWFRNLSDASRVRDSYETVSEFSVSVPFILDQGLHNLNSQPTQLEQSTFAACYANVQGRSWPMGSGSSATTRVTEIFINPMRWFWGSGCPDCCGSVL